MKKEYENTKILKTDDLINILLLISATNTC